MNENIDPNEIYHYFAEKLEKFGATPQGADWNSKQSQVLRFEQLIKVINFIEPFSLLDYGSGFGALYDYLVSLGHKPTYYGFDIVNEMVEKGCELHAGDSNCFFYNNVDELPKVDYAVVSGTFNIRLEYDYAVWRDYVLEALITINQLTSKGFSFNLLTKYSDAEHMKKQLFYADPCDFFDFCKTHFSKNVALLHDYGLYDFTILVRKDI